MTRDIVDRTRRIPTRWAVSLTLAVIAAAGLLFVRTVLAVHNTGAFEMDGDATSLTATPATDDWDRVCYEDAIKEGLTPGDASTLCGTNQPTNGAKAVAWTSEPDRNASIFTGGGSKDPQDITQWAWKDGAGGLPDKDNLRHAFAVRYSLDPTPASGSCPNGTGGPGEPTYDPTIKCEVLYFGSDRFDNSGDAQQGFWFFQSPVGLGTNSVGGGFGFTGVHRPGDVLVISDFSNGGTTSTITVYKWDPTCKKAGALGADNLVCGDTNLEQLGTSDAAFCNANLLDNDPFCGLVNTSPITLPWAFTDKSGTPGNGALAGEFFEAGINLSKLKLANECFSSVSSETRSSTSTTATLKDFVLGSFAVCAPALTTQASTNSTVQPGTAVTDRAIVQVTGAANPDDPLGTVTFHLCGPNATANPDCSTGGAPVGGAITLSNADCSPASPNNTDGLRCAVSAAVNSSTALAPGFYCFRATADLTNYADPAEYTDTSNECFRVADTSSTTTAQRWLPNDQATVVKGAGGPASGSVTFTLFDSANCTGTVLGTFGPITLDGNGQALTNNTTNYTASKTISWRVAFTSNDANVASSSSHCETSTVTINNDIGS